MIDWLAALATLVLHAVFIAFAALGGLLALRWHWIPWLHAPALAWAAWIEWTGGACPLTRWENHFLRRAGQAGYAGGFIEQYLLAMIYPDGLTRGVQVALAAGLLGLNLAVYGLVAWSSRNRRGPRSRRP